MKRHPLKANKFKLDRHHQELSERQKKWDRKNIERAYDRLVWYDTYGDD